MGNPLIRTAHWGEMRESNSRDWSHNPVPKPFGQSRHKTSGAGRVNRTLIGEVQALCTATVLDQQTVELARSLELRSGAYRAPALPVELYQRKLARRFERRSRTYEARALPTELHQHKTLSELWRRWGELHSRLSALQADALLSWLRRLIKLERKAGLEPAVSTLATSGLGL